jgi:hypothetical protein
MFEYKTLKFRFIIFRSLNVIKNINQTVDTRLCIQRSQKQLLTFEYNIYDNTVFFSTSQDHCSENWCLLFEYFCMSEGYF